MVDITYFIASVPREGMHALARIEYLTTSIGDLDSMCWVWAPKAPPDYPREDIALMILELQNDSIWDNISYSFEERCIVWV